jgi:hypothetical protein
MFKLLSSPHGNYKNIEARSIYNLDITQAVRWNFILSIARAVSWLEVSYRELLRCAFSPREEAARLTSIS